MKKEAVLYTKWIKEGFVKCLACHHYCQIPEGRTWICGIRKNENWKLYLLTWWKALGLNVDPIEKKPLFHVLPSSKAFSFGTAWCNFHCWFCQNWQMSQVKERVDWIDDKNTPYLYVDNLDKIWTDLLPEQAYATAKYYKCDSIAYTYNEPTVFVEYAWDTAKLTRTEQEAQRIKNSNKKTWEINTNMLNVFVSNGYESNELWDLMDGYLDAINIDLKGFSEEFYTKVLWWKLQPVLDNIREVYNNRNIFLEITTLIIPGENDSNEELKKIVEFIKSVSVDIPWHISAFHPDWKMIDKPYTPLETLERAYKIWKEAWLRYIYIGNVSVPEYETTYCPSCGKKLIERSGVVWQNVLDHTNGTWVCSCGTKIPGIWIENGKKVVRKETILS
jgi:pyruvate formate lyase activating enzyme